MTAAHFSSHQTSIPPPLPASPFSPACHRVGNPVRLSPGPTARGPHQLNQAGCATSGAAATLADSFRDSWQASPDEAPSRHLIHEVDVLHHAARFTPATFPPALRLVILQARCWIPFLIFRPLFCAVPPSSRGLVRKRSCSHIRINQLLTVSSTRNKFSPNCLTEPLTRQPALLHALTLFVFNCVENPYFSSAGTEVLASSTKCKCIWIPSIPLCL